MPHNELFGSVLSWLLTYAVHSSVLLGAVWLLLRCLSPRGLVLRERLWKLALVGPLVTASAQLALGARPWLGHFEWVAAPADQVAELGTRDLPELAREEEPNVEAPLTSRTQPEPHTVAPAARRSEPLRRPAHSEPRPAPSGPALVEELEPDAQESQSAPLTSPEPLLGSFAPEARTTAPLAIEASPSEARSSAARPPLDAEPELEEATRVPASTRVHAPPSWPGLMLLAWAALGLLGVLGVTASFVALYRRLAGREILRTGPLVDTLDALRLRAGLRRRVRLSISSRVTAPFSTGLFFPEICLPRAAVARLTPAQQEVLLAHELGHLLRRDPAWFTASYLLERVFFFQPLNRVARHELSELAELACDDWAVRWTGSRLALASCLTEVAGWLVSEPRRQLALPGLTAPRSPLGRRIARLLDDRRSPASEPRTRRFALVALAALGLTVAAVPGISAASPAPEREAIDLGPPTVTLAPADQLESLTLAEAERTTLEPAAEHGPAFEELSLTRMRVELEAQLHELENQIAELHAELAQRDLDARFAADLAAIEERMASLRTQQVRVSALLETLAPHTPAPAWR
jgi:beta-lactamase regulating signal transducer with metallopeptidase domain